MKKWIVRILAGVVALYLLAAFFVLPYLVRTLVPQLVHEKTGGTLRIESVFFNPFILSLDMQGITLRSPENEPFFSLKRFSVNVDVVPLLRGRLSVRHVGIYGPKLYIVQDNDGRFNFEWLSAAGKKAETTEAAAPEDGNSSLPAIVLEALELEDGDIDFTDLSRHQPLHLNVEPIGLTLTDIDTSGSGRNGVHFYAGTGSGGLLDVKSTIRSFAPVALDGKVEYSAGKLYLLYHFLQSVSHLELADGRIYAALNFNVDLGDLNTTAVDDINVTLNRLRIVSKASHADVLRIGKMELLAGPVYPLRGSAQTASVRLDDTYAAATRLEDGSIDWQHFLVSETKPAERSGDENATAASNAPHWDARIDQIVLTNLNARFEDRTLPKPAVVTIDDFNLSVHHVSTDLSKPVTFENRFALNGHGTVESNGSVTPEPLSAEANFSVKGLLLPPFDPYVKTRSYATIERGDIGVSGHVDYAPSDNAPDLVAVGDFRLNDLLVGDTREAMPLLSVAALDVNAFRFELAPNRLFADSAEIDAFYANIAIDRNKTLNMATLMKPTASEPAPELSEVQTTAPETEAFPIRIVRVDVDNGAVHFADASLPLPFDTQIHDVNGEVLGVSTHKEDTAYLSLKGEIDRYATAKAQGSFNIGDPKAYTDISVAFRNLDLSSYTPYSGKFVGRAIDTGKLGVTLHYRILNSAMKGDNSVVINRIELGRDIESNSSVSLPLDFAIALLEDSDGIIDIDMPVEGDVDNPDFKWGGVVWKAFVNLLTKAVTAPFDLIGSMLGIEGDALKYVPFAPGEAGIDAVSRERLDLLAKVLSKRPRLGITVKGTYDVRLDKRALQRNALIKAVLGTTADAKAAGGTDALSPSLLEPLYIKRFGADALAALRAEIADEDKKVRQRHYVQKLIEALIASEPLKPGALEALAARRAEAIRTYLSVNHVIDSGRMRTEPPAAAEAQKGYVATEIGLDAAQ